MPFPFKTRRKRTDDPSLRQTAQTLRDRPSFSWRKLLSSATRRLKKAAASLTGRMLTWLVNRINQNRTCHVRPHKVMTRQFHAALRTCYKHNKISKKEMKEAKRKWKEAMKNVKEEDRRREELWGEHVCVTEPSQ